MALIVNGTKNNGGGPTRFYGASGSTVLNLYVSNRSTWSRSGQLKNFYAGSATYQNDANKSGYPNGYRGRGSWCLPLINGGLSSYTSTSIELTDGGTTLVGGKNVSGSADVVITVLDATGGLITSGFGSAVVTLATTGSLIAVANGSGTSSVILSGSAALGAQAYMSSSAAVTITGTATSYAIGYMDGLSTNETEFSATALANAVWEALAASHITPGSMGEKLNEAGAAGNPWGAVLAANNTPGTFGALVQALPADVRTELLFELVKIEELHQLAGLDPLAPMTVTKTTRTAGDIELELTGDGKNTTTVTRV